MPGSNSENVLNTALTKVKYRHSDMTKRDCMNVMHHYRGLMPKQDKFIFNDGVQRDLITLTGTIPVPYKGQHYNIPIAVWLLDTHPYNAPLCYVRPTQDMQIKTSKHVDTSGKIYLPYLHEWSYPNSDLIGLIQICILIFSEQPPVYAKPKEPVAAPYPPVSGYPYPTTGAQPAYPPTPYRAPYPPYQGNSPGYPPYPPNPPTSTYPPYPPQQGGYNQPQPQPYYSQASTVSTESSGSAAGGTITQEHIKASILSAVEDKVRRRIREEFSTRQAEQESLKKIGEDLNSGGERLKQMMNRLNDESEELDRNIDTLEKKQEEMKDLIEKLEENQEINVDEAVTASAPLYRQLLSAYAEESATEDALYFLGEALRRGTVDVEVFLKHVRNLSRKQFLLRATMIKCRQKAGLQI